MTPEERAAVVRETVEACARAIAEAPVIVHSRGVNGRATLDGAAARVLSLAPAPASDASQVLCTFADLQRARLPRPARP